MAKRTCTIDGCERPTAGGPMCKAHYDRRRKGQSLDTPIRQKRPGGMSPTEAFRFFMPGDPPGTEACWIWRGNTLDKNGYGLIGFDIGIGSNYRAHRASYEIFVGPIPEGLIICHTCDNPPCVNPMHLYVGTPADNASDRDARGRHVVGDQHPGQDHWNATLTNVQAEEIRCLYREGSVSMRNLATSYGVSRSTIGGIVRGRTYKSTA